MDVECFITQKKSKFLLTNKTPQLHITLYYLNLSTTGLSNNTHQKSKVRKIKSGRFVNMIDKSPWCTNYNINLAMITSYATT